LFNTEGGKAMEPIVLTRFGETLLEYFLREASDDTEIPRDGCIGAHDICGGFFELRSVSDTHNIILCQKCNLRTPIPKEINTYRELREYLAKKVGSSL